MATLIADGEIIGLTAGTTTTQVARALRDARACGCLPTLLTSDSNSALPKAPDYADWGVHDMAGRLFAYRSDSARNH